jgi:aspartate aminotransferase
MTGWRIGYAAGPEKIIKEMKKIQSQSTSNPNSIAQAAAVAALEGKQDFIRGRVNTFKERHDFLINELKEIDNINVLASEGTFYSFPDMNKLIEKFGKISNDIELAEFFLDKAEVAMVPGSAFGVPGCMRISFATSMENLRESIKRIKKVL